ncbi:RNA-binding cell elongation regulator Jag/EloR [Carboxydochorda subterranea]|uniref:RNA-binding protein KhpB n=1 Tax=Carboxydichorda subterranea TaxID=3109565 RepID=A0ABZ1BWV8_9FIRM|nr:RNA-binding cell elongation regulator Jag/EloR [Limnochorda sp. L945t]WRP17115.1 RNA-binding cell elongation regulator Jag/EloR [Limnochorda sp. L945t]
MSGPRSVVKSGRSVEEALEAALDELGVGRDDVEVEVLEESNRGLLGWLGGRLARIRVTVRGSERGAPARASRARPAVNGREEQEEREGQRGEGEAAGPDPNAVERALGAARTFLRDVVRLIGADAMVETRRTAPDLFTLNVVSQRAALLIGRHGETLNALQLLTNLVANRAHEGPWIRFVVDAGDYRGRRESTLRSLALRAARKVRVERRRVALDPMNALERRIVHMALKDDPHVETRSEGEEPNRRVVIWPKGALKAPGQADEGGSPRAGGNGQS